MNQKGVVGLFLTVILLIAGIAVAVYLSQKPQIFKPKAVGSETVFYVSPNGSDTNDGSVAAPFKTIDKARQVVRTINKTATTDIFVYIKKGTYELTSPLVFDGDDSGFNGHYIRYISETPADRPLIHGGKIVTGWIQEGNKWKANIGTAPIRQLYVNNQRAQRVRTRGGISNFQASANGLTYSDDYFSRLQNPEDLEVVINNIFMQYRCGVQFVAGASLNMEKPCWESGAFAWKINPEMPQPVWLENAYDFLNNPGTPGEWYHNPRTGDLYYLPKQGEQIPNTTIIVPRLEKLIEGKGTTTDQVHNVVFQNLDFAYSTWLEPTTKGYIGLQGSAILKDAGSLPYTMANLPGAVQFSNSNNIWFVRNGFYHLGSAGISFDNKVESNYIIGNVFTDISAHAIFLGQYYSNAELSSGNHILNNYIHNIGVEFQDATALHVGYSSQTNISHNTIFDIPYSGISLPVSNSSSNLINKNLVYDHIKGENISDGGGVYVKGTGTGTWISENVIHKQHNHGGNIYVDDGGRNFTITSNVIYGLLLPNETTPYRTVLIKGCGNKIYDNYWQKEKPGDVVVSSYYNNDSGQSVACPDPSSEYNNTVITSVSQAPQNIVNAAGLEATYQDIKNFPPPLLPSPTAPPKPGDIDGNGKVDIFDFNLMVTNFGKSGQNISGDIDKNGKVDIFDFNLLITNFAK